MTKIKLCGLSRPEDIEAANKLTPEYVGFVFAPTSRRRIDEVAAKKLKKMLNPDICAVGVFVNSSVSEVARLLNDNTIDMAQLHGGESEQYISKLKKLTDKPILKAFPISSEADIISANKSSADTVLLDCGGGGSGKQFNHCLLENISRRYFLAGGLTPENVGGVVKRYSPYAVDVSSGIESGGFKDKIKMAEFVRAVRDACGREE